MERVLRRSAAASKAALAGLLRHMDEERQRVDSRLAQGLAAGSPEAAAELRKLQSGASASAPGLFGTIKPEKLFLVSLSCSLTARGGSYS